MPCDMVLRNHMSQHIYCVKITVDRGLSTEEPTIDMHRQDSNRLDNKTVPNIKQRLRLKPRRLEDSSHHQRWIN